MLRIDDTEQTVRMQTDLRLGLPIVITKEEDNFLIFSTERISKIHFSLLMNSKSEKPFLCVTSRRAQTLKARVYDNNISRIQIPEGSDINWIQATA
ncbi:MAG: GTP cyclohydrolase II, partial [Rhodobacteraceae bacterium]